MLHPSHFLPLRSHPRRPTVSFSQKRIIPSKRHRRFYILILTRFNPTALCLRAQSGLNLKKRKSSSAIILEKLCQVSSSLENLGKRETEGEIDTRDSNSAGESSNTLIAHAHNWNRGVHSWRTGVRDKKEGREVSRGKPFLSRQRGKKEINSERRRRGGQNQIEGRGDK